MQNAFSSYYPGQLWFYQTEERIKQWMLSDSIGLHSTEATPIGTNQKIDFQ